MAGSHPLAGSRDFWDDVMADMEATAEEYREAGWSVVELHPGDVTPLPTAAVADETDDAAEADRLGFDVLLPGDEFEAVRAVVEASEAAFDEYDAYRAREADTVFLVVAMKAEAAGEAVVFPLYYDERVAGPMCSLAAEAGELHTYLRPLDDAERVVFTHRDPDPLLPEESSANAGE